MRVPFGGSIIVDMKKIIKRLDKVWLAGFIPLTIVGYLLSGLTPLGVASLTLGAAYLAWQIYDA